jgi:hypothetical protein
LIAIRRSYCIGPVVICSSFQESHVAKKKSRIKKVVETVEGWVGMGPKAAKKKSKKAAKKASPKKGKKAVKKKRK